MKKFISFHLAPLLFISSSLGLFFIYIFSQIISLKPAGLFFGHTNVWSDWALHTGIANIFTYKSPQYWFSYHPLFADGKFTYPFVMDFISGMLMRLGIPYTLSFIFPSIFFVFILLFEIYFLFYLIFKSRASGVITIFLFMFSSGLGFINFFSDLLQTSNLGLILYPIKEYSRLDNYEWYTGNVVVGLLLPQRAFLLGMTIGVGVILGLVLVLKNEKIKELHKKIILTICGVLAGILPITHPHSFIAIVIITGTICLFSIKKIKLTCFFFIPSAIISIFLFEVFIASGIQANSFFTFFPGWTSHGLIDFIKMWIIFWGTMIPTALLSYFSILRGRETFNKFFFLPFFILFILGNLFLFQPIHWDNTKIFWWAYLGFCGLASALIIDLWKKNKLIKTALVILFLSLTLTGAIELIRLSRIDMNTHMETSTDDINLGIKIRSDTKPLDIFLTAPSHNHFIMVWAARPIVMGYTAWVWNFGFDYTQTYNEVFKIYQGRPDAIQLLKKHKVSYVVIGPGEISEMKANLEFYKNNFPLAFSNESYLIFDVKKIYK